ncbi:unnamed protein product [Gongylonema pulchrum]|uniref:Ovule protein n=1 Tax=Gongylonema pulchrum TaxID=637853 RepID=A0A183F0M8_9BILA|nr:unnamed protein product [Gongylonema pulchrum]
MCKHWLSKGYKQLENLVSSVCLVIQAGLQNQKKDWLSEDGSKNITVNPIPDWHDLEKRPHEKCGIECLQRLDKDPHAKEFVRYSPYMIPLLMGWKRKVFSGNICFYCFYQDFNFF